MQERLHTIQKSFVASIVGLVLCTMLALAGALVLVDIATYSRQISSTNIADLTSNHSDVSAYLESQKAASPHFVTIANLVKQDQQQALAKAFILVAAPIIIISLVVGYIIAKRLLQPVADSYEARDRFIQDAAHELRNPLAAMSATIETALAKPKQDEETLQTMRRLERQTNRLIQINEDLLYLQRASEAFGGRTNVAKIVHSVGQSLQAQADEKSIQLQITAPQTTMISIRPRDFEIVVRNLIDNAIKYSHVGGEVTITLEPNTKGCILTVTDTGIGIAASDQSKIIDKFYRGKNTTAIAGNGLGLALVDKVTTSYKGTLTITSKLGAGSTFSVFLPK